MIGFSRRGLLVHPVLLLFVLPAFGAQVERPSHEAVSRAIDAGVQFLLQQQDPDSGAWSGSVQSPGGRRGRIAGDHDVGRTALVGLALLNCGVPHHSPELRKAAEFLHSEKVDTTYSVSLRAAFFSQLPEAARKNDKGVDRLLEDRRWLSAAAVDRGPFAGLYTYTPAWNQRLPADLSNSQYAVLGLWYAAGAGVETSDALWKQIERGWVQQQNLDGGWGYRPDMRSDSYASMTAAGVATLFVTYDFLHARSELRLKRDPPPPPPRTKKPATDEADEADDKRPAKKNADPRVALERGMDWIAGNYAADENFGLRNSGAFLLYMLYGYERVAEATGRTRFGEHVWFDQAADFLLRSQSADGSWGGEQFLDTMSNTAYALLVLSRGRAPVLLQKLEFDGRWNNRSRDAAQLARWIGRQTERHLNWQIVNTDASTAELRESPILYIASDEALELPDEFAEKLREYLLDGGLLLCVAEGDAPPAGAKPQAATPPPAENAFAQSVEALGKQLFPRYEFRDLAPDHVLFTANFPATDAAPRVRGLSNGVRELIVLLPAGDLTWQWQRGAGTPLVAKAPHFGLIANLHLYVTDRGNPKMKGEATRIAADAAVQTTSVIRVARVRHAGNFDPEPAGWPRLAAILRNRDAIDLQVTSIDPADLAAGRFAVAHVTSTDRFTWTEPEQAALRAYADGGGLILFDAAGGSRHAVAAFEATLHDLFPNASPVPLPVDHPIYLTVADGPARTVTYRKFAMDRLPRTQLPRLKGVTVNGRLVAVVSEEDLSSGLVGHDADGIVGYSPQSAVDLVRGLIRWRGAPPPPPTPPPGRSK